MREDRFMRRIEALVFEQHILLRLLRNNSKRLLSTSPIAAISSEEQFTPSFLLPIGLLSNEDREELQIEAVEVCAVCGIPSTSYCSGCPSRSIRYCGPGKLAAY